MACATCQTPLDFRNRAISASYSTQSNYTYTIVGDAGMTAHVYVGGTFEGDPWFGYYWTPTNAVVMAHNGAAVSSDVPTAQAQMMHTDSMIFGFI